ncbi:MAG: hypothetical protein QGG20_07860, partial [Dehalococcoidia bacterium]|nr:hypothetical protein [Dehalococcoidia bacterium]
LGSIEDRDLSISVNLLGILHHRRLTEYNNNFGLCKGRKSESATSSINRDPSSSRTSAISRD